MVMAHALSDPSACGISSDQGLNPCPLYWQVGSCSLCHQGSPWSTFLPVCLLTHRCVLEHVCACAHVNTGVSPAHLHVYPGLSMSMCDAHEPSKWAYPEPRDLLNPPPPQSWLISEPEKSLTSSLPQSWP